MEDNLSLVLCTIFLTLKGKDYKRKVMGWKTKKKREYSRIRVLVHSNYDSNFVQ